MLSWFITSQFIMKDAKVIVIYISYVYVKEEFFFFWNKKSKKKSLGYKKKKSWPTVTYYNLGANCLNNIRASKAQIFGALVEGRISIMLQSFQASLTNWCQKPH